MADITSQQSQQSQQIENVNIPRKLCLYCNDTTHNISECNHPSIEILHNEICEATIFSYCISDLIYQHMTDSLNNKFRFIHFLRHWLLTKTTDELKIILYKCNKSEIFNLDINMLPSLILHISLYYYDYVVKLKSSITEKDVQLIYQQLIEISINKNSFIKILSLLINITESNIQYYIWHLYNPKFKYNIKIKVFSNFNIIYKDESEPDILCPICLCETNIPLNNLIITKCNHKYCFKCIISCMISNSFKNNSVVPLLCPLCRQEITSITIINKQLSKYLSIYCDEIDSIKIENIEEQLQEQQLPIIMRDFLHPFIFPIILTNEDFVNLYFSIINCNLFILVIYIFYIIILN
jgi:hypothetical protein